MAHDFTCSTDHVDVKAVVHHALESQGFAVETMPSGGWRTSRGSRQKTFWLGAMAGDGFRISLLLDFLPQPDGTLVVRLHRDMVLGALKGGAIGAAKSKTVFEQVANAIHGALVEQRALLASVAT